MNLFRLGGFTLASGRKSSWKIDCDALTSSDWAALARMTSEVLPPFGSIEGVPRGGLRFAEALRQYVTAGCRTHLVVDDVLTTGASMEKIRDAHVASATIYPLSEKYVRTIGCVVFARGPCPPWVTPLFQMGGKG